MKKSIIISLLLFVSFLPIFSQKKVVFDEGKLQINWELIANNFNKEPKVISSFKITNIGNALFPSSGWTLYFNYNKAVFPNLKETNFSISHVNGDVYQIKPSVKFQGLKINESIDLAFVSPGSILNLNAAPAGMFIVWDANPEKGTSIKNFILKPIVDKSINYITPEITYSNNACVYSKMISITNL